MTTFRIRAVVVGLALLAALAGSQDASAAVNKGVLSISPARRDITARPPQVLSPTNVKNTTQADMAVRVFPVLLFQNLDGSFGFNTTPRELSEAKLQLTTGPNAFDLKPQTQQTVHLRWNLLPRTAKAAYLGVVFEGVPHLAGKKSLGTVLRLLSVNFLSLPGHWTVRGLLTGLRGEQAGPKVLRFLPKVKNTGQIHAQPTNGRCKIVDSAGAVQVRSKFGTGIVLPGYEREYPILVKKILPAGSYEMSCAMRFGKVASRRTLKFKLSGPNTLPTPKLKLTKASASGEVGSSAHVHVVFRNAGTAPSNAVLKVALEPAGTTKAIVKKVVPQGSVAGGQSKTVDVTLGSDLQLGTYAADVILSDGKQDVDQLTASFTTTKHKGFFTKIWNWVKDHIAWLLLLLLLLGFLILFLLYRRRRREMEEELEAARAAQVAVPAAAPRAAAAPEPAPPPRRPTPPAPEPAPAPPPPPPPPAPPLVHEPAPIPSDGARINLNTASVEELMTLPGVGRRAAERIVAHREARGGFGSLEELTEIEGFHAERINRLRGSAEI